MTEQEIKQRGYEPIRDEQQLRELPDGFLVTVTSGNDICRWIKSGSEFLPPSRLVQSAEYLAKRYVGFRHVPDAVPVADGFEKKTEFNGICVKTFKQRGASSQALMAQHIEECHAHIDKQAAEIAELTAENREQWERSIAQGAEEYRLKDEIARLKSELAQLQSSREWVAIESAEQLDALESGVYLFKDELGKVYAGQSVCWAKAE